jgi:anaerobic selenocysteine-containing dehydrogenase
MDAYWVPSDVESALFGTKIADLFIQLAPGGDRAFLRGTLKALLEAAASTSASWPTTPAASTRCAVELADLGWDRIERESGVSRAEVEAYAELLGAAGSGVFVWGMGLTHHAARGGRTSRR